MSENMSIEQVLFSVQSVEEHDGYKMVVYGDDLSPTYIIFDNEGQEVDGNTLDMQIPSLQAWVEGHTDPNSRHCQCGSGEPVMQCSEASKYCG